MHCKHIFLFLTALLVIAGCSVEEKRPRRKYDLPRHERTGERVRGAPRLAWEVFPLRRDLEGHEFKSPQLLTGDEMLFSGRRPEALKEFEKAKPDQLTPGEAEALALRIASTKLSLRQAPRALSAVSEHFRKVGEGVEGVNGYFSVVLAYGYAITRDYSQALAWFSRTHRMAKGSGGLDQSAVRGATVLVQSLGAPEFEHVSQEWGTDSFIAGIIGQERRRRAMGGAPLSIGRDGEAFYRQDLGGLVTIDEDDQNFEGYEDRPIGGGSGGPATIGVLLPLSGKFASLGASVRNGIELALLAQPAGSKITANYRDDAGDPAIAASEARILGTEGGASVIMGPLLSELAEVVASVSYDTQVPVLTYSKKENFPVGRGVFRLGATSSSQVDSLLEAAESKLGLRKYAVVYPDDASGSEFARIFTDRIRQRGLELVFESSYQRAATDALLNMAARVEEFRPQAIFFPDNIVEATRFFNSLSPELRKNVVPLGPASWDNPEQLARSKVALDGAVFVTPFFALSSKEMIVKFREAYESRYKTRPDFLAAQGFDSATLTLAALQKHLNDGVPLDQAMTSIESYEGLTGSISVRSDGEVARTFVVVRLENGALLEVRPSVPQTFSSTGSGEIVRSVEPLAAQQPAGAEARPGNF